MLSVLLSSNGDFDYSYKDIPYFDYAIAVDGGIKHLMKLQIKPYMWVGDMDSSVNLKVKKDFIKDTIIEKLPIKKDMSDSDYAIEKAFEIGAEKIILIGGIGTRFDHSIFNVNMLFNLAKKSIECSILDGRQEISFMCAGDYLYSTNNENSMYIEQKKGKTLSIVPFSDLKSLSLDGFDYPLNAKDVPLYSNLTLSNVVNSDRARISLKNGKLLVIVSDGY